MTDTPAYLQPFVLPVAAPTDQRVDRVGDLDFYRPSSTTRAAAILFVHGGPGPPDLKVRPRDWPVYQGYATAAAQRGLVGVTVDHSLIRGLDHLAAAADDVEAALGVLRSDPQVDPNRIALWFFSGAGLLAGEWLDSSPEWLRSVALTYPLLAAPAGTGELVSAIEVIGRRPDLPVLLTRVGRERDELAEPVAEFVLAAGAALEIIDVPNGRHGFDMLDDTDESRAAVVAALDWTAARLAGGSGTQPVAPIASARPATSSTPAAAPRPAPALKPSSASKVASVAQPTPVAQPTRVAQPTPVAEAAPVAAPSAAVAAEAPAVPPAIVQESKAPKGVSADGPAAQVVAREHAAYDAHDLEAFLALYSPTARLQLADGTVKTGRRELREYYRPLFEAGRCKAEVTARLTVGGWVVDQKIDHGSNHGPRPLIALYRVQDGAIAEVRFLE